MKIERLEDIEAWHLAFFFPLTEKNPNWEKGYEFPDKEFQSIVKDLTGL